MIVLFHVQWILADEVVPDVGHRSQKGMLLVFQGSFSDTGDALVGVNFDKDPVGAEAVNRKGFYVGNFHRFSSSGKRISR